MNADFFILDNIEYDKAPEKREIIGLYGNISISQVYVARFVSESGGIRCRDTERETKAVLAEFYAMIYAYTKNQGFSNPASGQVSLFAY